jgi:hypothetical protein
VTTAREPGDVAGVAQDDRGAQRADPVDVGDGGARSQDGFDDALVDGHELVVEAANVAEQVERDAIAFQLDKDRRADRAQDLAGSLGGQQPAGAARMRLHSRACSRQIAWVRSPVRSWCRSASRRSTAV